MRPSRVFASVFFLFAVVGIAAAQEPAIAPASSVTVSTLGSDLGGDYGLANAPLQALDGNFYGVTFAGLNFPYTDSAIFRFNPSTSTYSVMHTLDLATEGGNGTGLVLGPDGTMYGVTGFRYANGEVTGGGVFYSVTTGGSFKALHSFAADEAQPGRNTLTPGSDGNFYLVSAAGGANGYGSIVQLTPTGTATVLYSFDQTLGSAGGNFMGSLVQARDGNYYGNAPQQQQGENTGPYGAIYRVTVSGSTAAVSIIHNFAVAEGKDPDSGLVVGPSGSLYGVTGGGGSGLDVASGDGTVFSITTGGALTKVYDFATNPFETGVGGTPMFALGSDQNFYGATYEPASQANYDGTVYAMTPGGAVTVPAETGQTVQPEYENPVQQGNNGDFYTAEDAGTSVLQLAFSPAQKGPVQLAVSGPAMAGQPFTLTYTVTNAFSLSMAQCYVNARGNPAGSGAVALPATNGTFTSAGYTGSVQITPTASGTHIYTMTCGGVETGTVQVTIAAAPAASTYNSISVEPSVVYVTDDVLVSVRVSTANGAVQAAVPDTVTVTHNGAVVYTSNVDLDANGSATITIPPAALEGAGAYSATSVFAGTSGVYAASSGTTSFSIVASPVPAPIQSAYSLPSSQIKPTSRPWVLARDGKLYIASALAGSTSGEFLTIDSAGVGQQIAVSEESGYEPDFFEGVVQGSDGNLWGSALSTTGDIDTIAIYSEDGTLTLPSPSTSIAGQRPLAASDGNLYYIGSDVTADQFSILKVTPAGVVTTLYSFPVVSNAHWEVDNDLIELSKGTFVGVASLVQGIPTIEQVVFSLTTSGTYTVLQDFKTSQAQSVNVFASELIVGPDSNIYAITSAVASTYPDSLVRLGNGSSLVQIKAYTQAVPPPIELYLASDGNLYGTYVLLYAKGDEYEFQSTFERVALDGSLTTISSTDTGNASPGYVAGPANSGLSQGLDGSFFYQGFVYDSSGNLDNGNILEQKFSPGLPPPVSITPSAATITLGSSVTLNWHVGNAFSATMQTCYAFQSAGGGGSAWSGQQPGVLSNGLYSGTSTFTPTAVGHYTYSLTCGGIESGLATVNVVRPSATTVTLTPSTLVVGSTLVLAVNVSGASGTPTGSVALSGGPSLNQQQNLGMFTLNNNGQASFSVPTEGYAAGSYVLVAQYSGDATYAPSTGSANLTLQPANLANSVVTVKVSPDVGSPGSRFSFSATVTGSSPTGTVSFAAAGQDLGTGTLTNGGTQTFTVDSTGVPVGQYSLVGTYSGDSKNKTSSGSTTVYLTESSVQFTLTPNPVKSGANISLKATVTGTGLTDITPSGTVVIYVGGQPQYTLSLTNGAVSATAPFAAGPGLYPIFLKYSGDSHYPASQSATITVTVQ